MYKVAVVGSGPAGFYAAEALFESGVSMQVDMLDRLPTPFGLVRTGVAPDHPKIKSVAAIFDRIATHPFFSYYGNVTVGMSPSVGDLLQIYDGVILACGAPRDRELKIPGEKLSGSYAATAVVGWYNGHPDFAHLKLDLSHPVAVVIGQGNVAADVARILLKPPQELAATDIAEHALSALRKSDIREVHIIGRRGPAQAKFTTAELRELVRLSDCKAVVSPADLILNEASQAELANPTNENAAKNLRILKSLDYGKCARTCNFRFFETPELIQGTTCVTGIRLLRNSLVGLPHAQRAVPTGEYEDLPCGLVVRSTGNVAIPLPGVPFDFSHGVVPNQQGRVGISEVPIHGLYVTGWLKRGANGVIGTNRPDSVETVQCLLEDLGSRPAKQDTAPEYLRRFQSSNETRPTTYADWKRIDRLEVERGKLCGKPREKFVRIEEMVAALELEGTVRQ